MIIVTTIWNLFQVSLYTQPIHSIIIQRALHTSNQPQQLLSASISKRLKNNSFQPIQNVLAPYLKRKTKNNPQTTSDIKQNTNNLISNIAKNQAKYGISVVIKRMSLLLRNLHLGKAFIIFFPQIPNPKNLLFRIYHLLMTHQQNKKL